jgi:hypothetical protein
MCPVVGISAPTNNFANVDFPEPVSPTIAKVWCDFTSKVIGSNAVNVLRLNQFRLNLKVLLKLMTCKS